MLGARGDTGLQDKQASKRGMHRNPSPTPTRVKRGCMPLQHRAAARRRCKTQRHRKNRAAR